MDNKIFFLAKKAMENAYAPYSKYKVGACILSESGKYYVGANMENAAYPQGICAECSAMAAMITAGDREIIEIAVVTKPSSVGELGTPCGGCRQKIREFATTKTLIHVCNTEEVKKTYTMEDILPDSFGPNSLM